MTKDELQSRGLPFESVDDGRTKALMFGISALLHAVVFLALIFMPDFGDDRYLGSRSITVSLVTLPGPGGGGPAPAPAPEPAPIPPAPEVQEPAAPAAPEPAQVETAPPPPEPPADAISIAPKETAPPVKEALKKKTKTGRKLEVTKATPPAKTPPKPQAKPPEQAPERRSESVSSAIAALQNRVAEQERHGSGAAGASGGGDGTGAGPGGMRLIDMYRVEVALTVERNWAFSEHLAGGGKALETLIVFRVLPNGEVTDFEFVKKSGNRYLDESAYKAVMKSSPFSPHPDGIRRPYVEIPLRFTPSGIR
ncbi:MAG: energy transducer TonB [Desulfobacterales bacterium]